uniref:ATP-binding cassette sub-family A member 1-like n=1 Tax=Phallusia mammillata TaxID=59560 RepID=A0A6F9D5Y5_9ASCI|nr:ATP-binding cassette sub-family A member 1-like [Phallusia mammillata]
MFWKQLRLLLWKNYILRKRHLLRTAIEIIWPLFLLAVLIAIRKTQVIETKGECHYPARAMPSAGVYPWFKSLLCDIQNPCFSIPVSSETPGQINNPNELNRSTDALVGIFNLLTDNLTSLNNLGQLSNDLTTLANSAQSSASQLNQSVVLSSILNNPLTYFGFLTGPLALTSDIATTVVNSNVTFFQAVGLPVSLGTRTIVCNATALDFTLQIPASGPSTVSDLSTALCSLSDNELALLSNVTAENLGGVNSITRKFATQGITVVDQSIYQTEEFLATQKKLNAVLDEFQILQGSLQNILGNSGAQGISATSILSIILGVDVTSPNAVNNVCGHPQNKTTVISGFLDGYNDSTLDLSSIFNTTNRDNSAFCQNLIDTFQNNSELAILWDTVKPLLLGKIPFAPDTPLIRTIIKQANATFESIAFLENIGETWQSTNGPALYQELESGQLAESLRAGLNNPLVVDIIMSQTNLSGAQIEQLKTFLLNDDNPNDNITTWKDTYRQIDGLVVIITKLLGCLELNKFEGFDTEYELEKHAVSLLSNNTLWGGIVFISPTTTDVTMPEVVKYKIRQDSGAVTWTTYIQRFFWRPGPEAGRSRVRYYISGFVHLQDLMDSAILHIFGSNSSWAEQFNSLGSYLQVMPYPCYTRDRFLEYLSSLLSLIMTLAWIYSVCIIIKNIVYEKEQRLKEVMKMMGLSNGVHWVAWFINSFLIMFVSIVLMVIILKAGAITPFSNMFIILMWLCCFAFATIAQCFLISCFFSKANLAAACGGIIYFLLYIPYNMVIAWDDEMTLATKIVACLLSNIAFGYGAGYISEYEMSGDGVQFSNWGSSPDPNDQLNFAITLIMMLVDAALYFMLTWYIENVFPGKYGVPRPWYFFATRSYWCGSKPKKYRSHSESPVADVISLNVNLEPEPSNLQLGVAVHNIRKVYSNGKVAVDDLSLNFYEDQITSFLGHNGAGKTTTMSMLTGLFTPTSGTAYVYGNDICTEMDSIRSQLGFCPQHNVLFGDLTVQEHLELYSGLKDSKGGKKEIEQMLKDVGLPHKKNEVSRHLSGGMKRKLSVAVAFVGGSKCVILDEPTAGVDPYARRGIWDLLLAYRKNRTIILSTHHMDEADLLGDRIAIISHGKLKCCGSSIFLKSSYGVGYYLTLVKNEPDAYTNPNTLMDVDNKSSVQSLKASDEGFESLPTDKSSSSSIDATSSSSILTSTPTNPTSDLLYDVTPDVTITKYMPPITDGGFGEYSRLVLDIIPSAKLHEQDAREVTFVLPYAALNEGCYAKLFSVLDRHGIGYGLTDTSLEEIFLAVAEESKDEGKDENLACCCCFPSKRKTSVEPNNESNTEFQARRGSGRRRKRPRLKLPDCCYPNLEMDSLPYSRIDTASHTSLNTIETTGETDVDEFGDGSQGRGSYQVSGNKLVLQQFRALFIKRFHHARRNGKGFVASVIVPAVFVALALAFALIIPGYKNLPPLELQPWMYGDSNTFYSLDDLNSSMSVAASEALLDKPGIGMRCVKNYTVTNYDKTLVYCNNPGNQTWSLDDSIRGHSQLLDSNETLTCTCTGKETRVLLAECPVGAGGEPTERMISETRNPMYNMTGRNVADWMVKTTDRFRQERYGGLSFGEKYYTYWTNTEFSYLQRLLGNTTNNSFVNIGLENFVRTENNQVWFDNNGYHSMPSWLNVLNNAALRSLLPPGVDRSRFGIAAINHPLNFTENQVDEAAFTQSATDTIISICVIFALSFIPASFVLFLIEEKVTKAKHLQFVSGVNQFVYWITNFMWDLVNYAVPAVIVILIFVCFQTKAYVSPQNLPCLVCLLLLYGFAITPMMYPASFYFTVPSTAYVVLTCVNLFIGINASIATFILEYLDDPTLTEVNYYLQRIFLIFPQYCLGRALIDMGINQAYADAYATFGIDRFQNPFDFDLVGRNLLALACEGTFFFIFTVLIQYRFFIKPRVLGNMNDFPVNSDKEDEDVKAERDRIVSGRCDDIMQIKNLSKIYKNLVSRKPLLAVDRMYVGVPRGECFGLLGVNGAGKTTTFKMLTGDTAPSSGDASICGQSILSSMRDVQQSTGYCPQFEALNSLLTGREHLEFYAKLRGVPPEDIARVASWGIDKFGLKLYAEKCAGTYSGGNKRKLSAAIAFIGCPPVVFLDEPTAGMDPMSRRFLWTRIAEAVRGGRCIVLTSHSMEECEALCSRLAIMVNGRFKCIGSPQHLKNRFGEGYTLTVKVDARCEEPEKAQKFITASFPTSILKEHHSNMLLYQLPLNDVKLSYLFDVMERNKEQFHIEDYSLSQTTLDEVFVNFARMQTDGLEDEYGLQTPSLGDSPAGNIPGLGGDDGGIVLENLRAVRSTDPMV